MLSLQLINTSCLERCLMLISLMAIFSSNIFPTIIHLLPPPTVKASICLLAIQNVCPDLYAKLNPRKEKTPLGIPWILQGLLMEVKHSSYKMSKWIKMLFLTLLNNPAGFGMSPLPKSTGQTEGRLFLLSSLLHSWLMLWKPEWRWSLHMKTERFCAETFTRSF